MNILTQDVFDLVVRNPGIDAPLICLVMNEYKIVDPDLRGPVLAHWLTVWFSKEWNETCTAVDELIESGQIIFGDDGELRATGYST